MKMDSFSTGAKFECLLFDMDDTLYPMSTGINLACRHNIEEYMRNQLSIKESEVPKMCLDLYKEYGTTMAGLKALGYEFDYDEFHSNVHGKLPYDKLKPDPVLKQLLLSMPQRKIIFTNADKAHAAEVLSRLGLEECFEGVICFETLNEVEDSKSNKRILCKPMLEAMKAAIQIAKIDPKKTIFFDDSARNIATGKAAGLHTVVVGTSVLVPGADVALESMHNIKEALPEIWEGTNQLDSDSVIQPASVETVVLA
ncbi:hypothetical protein LUZ61_001861 [Rhynchospora tenuis]|uniref:Pyrimidine 5-nucleotidase n=1 Tax=Rhynchospora tenuis TaxID=198213 RepID=A0AAD6ER98_9POAL|nr:hypothetical protein LUZ61_001861 [Rhynchospora tenuis]